MGYPQWIYHKFEDAKIIDSDELPEYVKAGWKERPMPVEYTVKEIGDKIEFHEEQIAKLKQLLTDIVDEMTTKPEIEEVTEVELITEKKKK